MENELKKMLKRDMPKITDKQIKIIDFWLVRGYSNISHTLGFNASLHLEDRFTHLGLNLQYLEQFYDFAQKELEREGER